uniref:Ig-like domain-containing protein n=1 Tax=Neogobius melanostomus TaxID=47308 RepID=A0A8C6SSY6_9GOBI
MTLLHTDQLFDYTSLTVNCEGFFNNTTQWKVLRNVSGQITSCNTNRELFGPCHIPVAYPRDSGEYWCESRDSERRSESVHITVSGLEDISFPVHPVMVGDDVTLRCIERENKKVSTEFYFYKDGAELNTSPTGEMTIHNISESDQGLYRCSTSEGRESEEQWLAVRGEDGIQHNLGLQTLIVRHWAHSRSEEHICQPQHTPSDQIVTYWLFYWFIW